MENRPCSSERLKKTHFGGTQSLDSTRNRSHDNYGISSHTLTKNNSKYKEHRPYFDDKSSHRHHNSTKYSNHSTKNNSHSSEYTKNKYEKLSSDNRHHSSYDRFKNSSIDSRARSPKYSISSDSDNQNYKESNEGYESERIYNKKSRKRSRSVSLGNSGEYYENHEDFKDETELIKNMLGITSFDTTKNKKHEDSSVSGVKRKSRRKYRQYMNRRGGFNHPLSPTF